MRKLTFILILLFSTSLLFAQYRVVEDYITNPQQTPGAISNIPYAKYVFDNGLTLIINEDHSDPAVTLKVIHKNGSSASPSDRTPLVYLIAHYLYGKNNQSISDMQKLGLSFNWSIDPDKIEASYTFSKDMFDMVLIKESANIKNFISSINQDAYDKERIDIIQSIDLKESYDPFYSGYSYALKTLYPMGHPYGWHSEGIKLHYEGISLEDLQKFYFEWFGANNLILSISGDLNKDDVLKKVNKYFADHFTSTYGPSNIKSYLALRDLDDRLQMKESRYLTLLKEGTNPPKLIMIYPTTKAYSNESVNLDVAAFYFGNETNGIITKALKNAKLASKVNITHKTLKYHGEFRIEVTAYYNVSLARIKDTIIHLMTKSMDINNLEQTHNSRNIQIADDGSETISNAQNLPDQLNTLSFLFQNQCLLNYETSWRKAELLASYEFYHANPDYIQKDFQQRQVHDPNTFMNAVNSFIFDMPFVAISILSKDQSSLKAGPDNWQIQEPQSVITHATPDEIKNLGASTKVYKSPKIKNKTNYTGDEYTLRVLDNGMVFVNQNIEGAEMLNIRFVFDLKTKFEVITNPIISELIVDMFKMKYETLMNGDFKKHFLQTGSFMDISMNDKKLIFDITTRPFNLNIVKEMMREYFYQPTPLITDFHNKVERFLDAKEFLNTDLSEVFDILMFNQFYEYTKEEHSPEGPIRDKFVILLSNLINLGNTIISPENAFLFVNGEMASVDLMDFQEAFRQLEKKDAGRSVEISKKQGINAPLSKEVFFIHQENKANVGVLINFLNVNNSIAKDVHYAEFLKYILTNADNNILNASFASKEYVKSMKVSESLNAGIKSYFIEAEVTEEAMVLFIQEVQNIFSTMASTPLDKNQFRKWKLAYTFKQHIAYESLSQKLDYLQLIQTNNYKSDYLSVKNKLLKKISNKSIKGFVSSQIQDKHSIYLISGNRNQLQDKLANAGFSDVNYINVFGKKILKRDDK